MKKIYLLIYFFWMGSLLVMAQQRPQMSQYMLNNYLTNPAVTGIEDYTDIRLGHRQQWVGLEGAPTTFYATIHTPINKSDQQARKSITIKNGRAIVSKVPGSNKKNLYMPKPHHGVGATILRDKSGAIGTVGMNVSYAFHLPVSKQVKLSVGASTGITNYTINPNMMNLFDINDPIFGNGNLNRLMYDLNVGVWAYSHNFYTGVSISQLVMNRKSLLQEAGLKNFSALQRQYNLTGGYKMDVTPKFSLIPSVLVKFAMPSPPAVDLNLKLMYDNRLFVGGSYRREDAFTAIAGMHINTVLDFGYSYDATASELNGFSAGSHELVLGIKLFNKKKIICPNHLW